MLQAGAVGILLCLGMNHLAELSTLAAKVSLRETTSDTRILVPRVGVIYLQRHVAPPRFWLPSQHLHPDTILGNCPSVRLVGS
jgi:hypothetical protein